MPVLSSPFLRHLLQEPAPDWVFEVTEASLAAVSPRQPAQLSRQPLDEHVVTASPSTPNVLDPAALRAAIQRTGAPPGRRQPRAAVVVPDHAARLTVLDFEQFPAKLEDRDALVRFRLRKSVPFPVDEAQVAHAVQWEEDGRVEVLAVIIARPILDEYESAFRDAGFQVGLVTPAAIASVPICRRTDQSGCSLLAKAGSGALSLILFDRRMIRLVRCVPASPLELTDERQLLPLLQQTLAYAEDELGKPIEQLLFAGFGRASEQLGMAAQREFDLPFDMLRSRFGPGAQEHSGLFGLLEQYAA